MSQNPFLDRIHSGATLVSDGATGSNLQQRGLPRGVPSEVWLFERPEEIVRLHQDFIQAGADILLTCTFGASPVRLEGTALEGKAVEVNRRAVELARQAVGDRDVYIAGSIGPCGQLLQPYGALDESRAFASFAGQARALGEAGADLLVIETQFDLNEARSALVAAREANTLPVVVSFSYDRGTRSMMGVKPAQVAAEFGDGGADLLGINCGRSLEDNLEALKELRLATSLPIWFKPNAGLPQVDAEGNPVYTITPESMGALVPRWLEAGAQVIGGCCGTSPEHLAQIALQKNLRKP